MDSSAPLSMQTQVPHYILSANNRHQIMTGGRKSSKNPRRKTASKQQSLPVQALASDDSSGSPPNIRREQPPPQQVVKKILKADNDEARTLKTVFKSNPDSQMKEFIKIASTKPTQQTSTKTVVKTPAENHPPAIAQELLETDDDVADNLVGCLKLANLIRIYEQHAVVVQWMFIIRNA